ncbi:hypothetical protein BDZ94DRAFT_1247177 [Collybia nuda]|uniref:Uncharacterized protein n=1 Tax=Collybia nuda TaxID=64659 RepID=A0A9P6CPY6_9AGAR|nr:hypothetical protein BDZ94DRAFT_1247177 [Collybia nuda]
MYSNGYGGPEITNNPFIDDPSHPQTRFPDLNHPSSPPNGGQYTQWLQHDMGQNNTGYPGQQSNLYQPPPYQQPQPQQYSSMYGQQQAGYLSSGAPGAIPQATGMPFQPTSSFGQQLAANMSGSSYAYLHGQTSGQQPYTVAQQTQNNPGYIAQFDPYASIGQGWDGQTHQTQSQPPQNSTSGIYLTTPSSGNLHPREYIRTHKAEIEAWDNYAWKQLLNSFDILKDSWEARTRELGGRVDQFQNQLRYGGGGQYPGQLQQETTRLQELLKDAQIKSDSVAASSFQMHEVFQGYRQSGDLASKRRVREASNAALQGLPDWPPQVY